MADNRENPHKHKQKVFSNYSSANKCQTLKGSLNFNFATAKMPRVNIPFRHGEFIKQILGKF